VGQAPPEALVLGRDLVEMGWAPGPHFKGMLDRIYEAQLEGKFSTPEGGRDYARSVLGVPEGDGHRSGS
jgi:hypothetical protein